VNLLNEATLALVKPGLHLVNIARGALIDQEALRVALDDDRLARASLDVCVPEPLPAGHWLYTHEKVFLTPHASWTGVPLLAGAIEVFCKNLRNYLDGKELVGVVDVNLGY
jgi:phosphoglycerate dehydrogenase-like enzyme